MSNILLSDTGTWDGRTDGRTGRCGQVLLDNNFLRKKQHFSELYRGTTDIKFVSEFTLSRISKFVTNLQIHGTNLTSSFPPFDIFFFQKNETDPHTAAFTERLKANLYPIPETKAVDTQFAC